MPVRVSGSLNNLALLARDLGEAEAGVPPAQLNPCPAQYISCTLQTANIGL